MKKSLIAAILFSTASAFAQNVYTSTGTVQQGTLPSGSNILIPQGATIGWSGTSNYNLTLKNNDILFHNPSGGTSYIKQTNNSSNLCLDVIGTSGVYDLYIKNNGNIGFGTNIPTEKLDLTGNIILRGINNGGYNFSAIKLPGGNIESGTPTVFGAVPYVSIKNGSSFLKLQEANTSTNSPANVNLYSSGTMNLSTQSTLNLISDGLIIKNGVNERMRILSGGAVVIGDYNALGTVGNAWESKYKLAVGGAIYAEELKIQLTESWADYVFDPNYNLKSLKEVKEFISQKGHLPGIPSAKKIESEGLSVSHIQVLQMEKIEELTLHLIQVNQEKDDLEKRLEKIEALLLSK